MPETIDKKWDIDAEVISTKDPLLYCLLLLTKYYDIPSSVTALTDSLPLVNHCLTPSLFIKAAQRVGLAAELNKLKLQDIQQIALPAVLLLQDGQACILCESNAENSKIIIQGSAQAEINISTQELVNKYLGYVIFIKPGYKFSQRIKEVSPHINSKNWFWDLISKAKSAYLDVFIASVIINLFALAIPLFSMNIYDRVVPNHAVETMWVLASGVIIIFLFDLFLKFLRAYFIDITAQKLEFKISSAIFGHALGIRSDLRPNSVGVVAYIIQSLGKICDILTSSTIAVCVDLPFVCIYLVVTYVIGGNLVLVPICGILVLVIFNIIRHTFLISLIQKKFALAAEKQANLTAALTEIDVIKVSGSAGIMLGKFEKIVLYAAKVSVKLSILTTTSHELSQFIKNLVYVLVIICGVYKIIDGELSIGSLIACTILSGLCLASIQQFLAISTKYLQAIQAYEAIDNLMQLPTDIVGDNDYLSRPNLQGNIEIKNVDYRYPKQLAQALTKINIKIQAGEKVGIIGTIGCGKSTLAKLLVAIYRPENGSISFDDTNYLQINPADIRRQIGYVGQDAGLISGSIKDNIVLGALDIEDEAIFKAALISGVTSFINRFPAGFDTQVGELGNQLSVGERQAIALARSILLNPKILILDEPTFAMDDSTAKCVHENLKNHLQPNMTLILITNKSSMLSLVDRLIVLDEGQVVADNKVVKSKGGA